MMQTNPQRYGMGGAPAGGGFNAMSAGAKHYGASGRHAPNIGPSDPTGYAERDRRAKAQQMALLQRLQAFGAGRHLSADAQRPIAKFGIQGRL